MSQPSVLLSAFADEASPSKSAVEELAVCSAMGLEYYSVRFVDVGSGIKNIMKLSGEELAKLAELHRQYDMKVASIGSPIGKVKLLDKEDGTKNPYIPFAKYLAEDVMHAIKLAHHFETKLVRGFSFYPPKGEDPSPFFQQAIDQVGQIVEKCGEEGVVFGLEIEANLIGSTGPAMAKLYEAINHSGMVLIFDGANLSCQNLPANEVYNHYQAMKAGMGWMHVKDYKIDSALAWHGHVDEERLKNFVPCDIGDSGHKKIFADLATHLPVMEKKMKSLGAPGVFLDLEPHLRGGGQFGGYSGSDGIGIALRALCRELDKAAITYKLRDFARMIK